MMILNWKQSWLLVAGITLFLSTPASIAVEAQSEDTESYLSDFGLFDEKGEFFRLSYYENDPQTQGIVLFVQGNGCPLVRKRIPQWKRIVDQYESKGLKFWMINANSHDSRAEVIEEAEEYKFPSSVLLDDSQLVGEMLGLTRTAEILLIDTKEFSIKYRGPIDNRLDYAREKPEASKTYLKNALDSFIDGKEIEVASVPSKGCKISYSAAKKYAKNPIDYTKDIAPIIKEKCVRCHTKGGIGPFAISSHRKVTGWVDMIEEVVMSRRMPPWQADPHFGEFANNFDLTVDERQKLIHWIRDGAEIADGAEDPLKSYRPEIPEWALGTPHHVINIPEQKVPAEGIIDYRYEVVDNPFGKDVWVGGVDIRPGNTKVLHHIIAYVEEFQNGKWERTGSLAGYAPGMGPDKFPEGSGMILKKTERLLFELHYTACGTPEVDNSRLGIYLLPEPAERVLHSGLVIDTKFRIKANNRHFKHHQSLEFDKDITLYSMNPHMHLRGKAMKYVLHLPDKTSKTLLSVPHYDFNWQRNYILAQPLEIPKGSRLTVHAVWDNSERNQAISIKDANKEIGWGEQSFDEMFFATFTYTEGHGVTSPKLSFTK